MLFLPQNLTAASLRLLLRGRGKVISHSDRYSVFKVQWKGLSLIPTGRTQIPTLSGKIFSNLKIPLTYLHKGCRNAHPFWGFSKKILLKIYPFTYSHWEVQNYRVFLKNFLSGKKLSHLFGIAKPNDTLFHRKIRKYFFGCGWLYFLAEKAPSLIPTGSSQMHTLNRKKFYPFTYLELRGQNAPCFSEKRQKIFLKRRFVSKTSPHLFPLAEDIWG